MDLLFVLCTWHACAKLRLHTSSTLQILKNTTKALGKQMRYWVKKTCSAFETRRLPKEESARDRRKAASKQKPSAKGKSTTSTSERGTTRGRDRRRGRPAGPLKERSAAAASKVPKASTSKEKSSGRRASGLRTLFSMCTYKLHALGDYVAAIARYGTTDNYSTQVVSRLIN
jgi:hypothetical protein